MPQRLVPLLFLGAAMLSPALAEAGEGECMATVSSERGHAPVSANTSSTRASASRTVVYLNRHGERLRSGDENSSRRQSEVLSMRGIRAVTIPPWSRGRSAWNDLVGCVQSQFEDYGVTVVDERPTAGTYVMAMVGGRSNALDLPRSVGGIAPYNGRVIDDAIVYVFEQSIGSAQGRCEATAHEIGHALGLDHSTDCRDVMSYGSCGPKRFVNAAAACGEFSPRGCSSGAASQNSHAHLARAVGQLEPSRARSPSPPRSGRDRPRTRHRSPAIGTRLPSAGANKSSGPRIQIQSAAKAQRGDSRYVVQLRARDPDGIARVELFWTDGRRAYRLQCGRAHGALPVHCSRRGDQYTFALGVGFGERAFAVRVTDGDGMSSVTRPRGVRLY